MQLDNLLLFSPDSKNNYYPFTIMHPLWELRVGALRIFEKYEREFPSAQMHFNSGADLLSSFLRRFNIETTGIKRGNLLALDSSILPTTDFINEINNIIDSAKESCLLINKSKPIGLFLMQNDLEKSDEFSNINLLSNIEVNLFSKLKKIEIANCTRLNYLFDAIEFNHSALLNDVELFKNEFRPIEQSGNFFLIQKEDILCGENVQIAPNVVLDASDGPIILGNNVRIMAQSTILGPAYIGDNSIVKIGAKIYQNTSIGEYCKIGGEVDNSIIQSYSNKQHEGYLGDSFISEWVNLGADTNTSNLKNTYSAIKIRIEREEINTGKIFLGLLCGDHTKSGINSMFNTGTVCGIGAILVNEWYLANFIPSFSWGGSKNSMIYKVDKALDTARIVLERRGKTLLPDEEHLMRKEYLRVVSLYEQ
ncbi:MAG: putative sugar nucleotidyl transferase [Chloroherpetonaceae bacterium]